MSAWSQRYLGDVDVPCTPVAEADHGPMVPAVRCYLDLGGGYWVGPFSSPADAESRGWQVPPSAVHVIADGTPLPSSSSN